MKGNVFDIQRFSIHDGPGIRQTIFLKGCPLRCKWCHNPEGLENKKSLRFLSHLCINCQSCEVCSFSVHTFLNSTHTIDFNECQGCGKCIDLCPSKALILYGKCMEAKDVAFEAYKDKDYYSIDGGVTFSGGEPLLQVDFVIDCVNEIRKLIPNIHVCIDTSGCIPYEYFEKIIPYTNIFLFDIKAISEDIHIKGTGVSNKLILENLKKLDQENKEIWIRIPIIPQINNSQEELIKIRDFIKELNNVKKVTLIPFHSLGYNKYQEMGYQYHYDETQFVSDEEFEYIKNLFLEKGIVHQP